MEKVIFLDRDGVINEKAPPHEYITRWADFRFLPGVPGAIRRLCEAGYRIVIVSNQRCVARGLAAMTDIDALHATMCGALEAQGAHIDAIYVCPHAEGECTCRKPDIGLLLRAEERFAVDKAASFLIGDSRSDIEAGERYGVHTILVNNMRDNCGEVHCADLAAAAAWITERR